MAKAICWASGLIEVLPSNKRPPSGSIIFLRCKEGADALRDRVAVKARHGYSGELLVPGVPEAVGFDDKQDALKRWLDWAFPGEGLREYAI